MCMNKVKRILLTQLILLNANVYTIDLISSFFHPKETKEKVRIAYITDQYFQ